MAVDYLKKFGLDKPTARKTVKKAAPKKKSITTKKPVTRKNPVRKLPKKHYYIQVSFKGEWRYFGGTKAAAEQPSFERAKQVAEFMGLTNPSLKIRVIAE